MARKSDSTRVDSCPSWWRSPGSFWTHWAQRTNSGEYLEFLTPERPFMERYWLAITRALVDSKNAVIYTRIFNRTEENVKIY